MKVSVIVPTYNNGFYITKCIESILNQTYSDLEIIVIDDGSTDETKNILESYKDKIIVVSQENHGVSYSRNQGLKKATGEYVMFVDGDDWIEKDMIEHLYQASLNGQYDLIRCGYIREYPNRQEPYLICDTMKRYTDKQDLYQMFLMDYRLASPCCQLIRRSCIQTNFDVSIQMGEDYLFNLDVYTHATSVVLLPNTYYHYFYNTSSATTTLTLEKIQKRCEDVLIVYSKLYEYLKVWNMNTNQNRKLASYRILKELNMKLLACFQTDVIGKNEQKKLIQSYFKHPLFIQAKKQVSVGTILSHIHGYTIFLLCMTCSNTFLYYVLGKTIYRSLYRRKR